MSPAGIATAIAAIATGFAISITAGIAIVTARRQQPLLSN